MRITWYHHSMTIYALAYSNNTVNESKTPSEGEIKRFYSERKIVQIDHGVNNEYSIRDISPYDYSKKNKLDNKTEAKAY